jgi:ADP-heptose:LPS heptosyltransferase
VVIQGSAAERPLGQELSALVRAADVSAAVPPLLDLCGELDVRGLVALSSLCTAFVAGDTGPMHVARALGVPTVAVFGSTDPGMFEWGGHHPVVAAGVACAPCSFHGRKRCPRGHLRCLTELGVAPVWAAVEAALSGGRGRFVSA